MSKLPAHTVSGKQMQMPEEHFAQIALSEPHGIGPSQAEQHNPETRMMVKASQPVSAFRICLCMCARLLCGHPQKRLQKAAEVLQQNLISFDITPPLQQLQHRYRKRHAAINCCSRDILVNFLWRL